MNAKLPKYLKTFDLANKLRNVYASLSNQQRKSKPAPDYILMMLPQQMPAMPESRGLIQRRIFGEPPLSLWELERRFQRIASDPRPKGVILHLRGLSMSLADLQTLRDSITLLQEKGKAVLCYAQGYDLATYYVASAADEIIIQPGGNVFTVGLRQEALFFKDALDRVGIEVDSIAISPYKGAADQFTRREISPEGQEQLEWLLDSRYEQIIDGIAAGRDMTAEKVREIIDSAPYLDKFAKGVSVVDAVLNEEELYTYLGTDKIDVWEEADKTLYIQKRQSADKYIAVLPIEGLIVAGESANPPGNSPIPLPVVQDGRAGDITVVRQIRALMSDDKLGGVVLFVNSGGGSATASEAMRAALAQLARKVPVVVYMNGVAASGGYWVSTPGRYIVAQPGTITGSIGVLIAKAIGGDLREKLMIRASEFMRGENADIFSSTKPFTDGQRAWLTDSLERTYDQFLELVSLSRGMSQEDVDAIGGGRVWTGQQALENGLVDELGGFAQALAKVREFGELSEDAPVALVSGKTKPLAPQVAERTDPAASLRYLAKGVGEVLAGQPQLLMPLIWTTSTPTDS